MSALRALSGYVRAAVAVSVLVVAVAVCGAILAPTGFASTAGTAHAAASDAGQAPTRVSSQNVSMPTSKRADSAQSDDGKAAFHIRDDRITESSGLAMSTVHDGIVYTINDSNHPAEVYAVDTSSGDVAATLEIGEVEQRDWEALASGPGERIWIGDIGDNSKSQTAVTAYRFREPDELVDAGVPWSRYRLRYEDGRHNAETLLVHPKTGRLYVVTKQLSGAAIYQAPKNLSDTGDNTLTKVADAPMYVTDGSFAPDGASVVLRGYAKGYVYNPEDWSKTGEVGLPLQGQGESLTVTSEGESVLVGSEGANSPVHEVSLTDVKDEVQAPEAPPKSPDPKPSRTRVQREGGGVSNWLGGLPWWVPVTILVVAVVAGVVAYLPAREPKRGYGDQQTPPGPSYPGSPRENGSSTHSEGGTPDRLV